MNLNEVITSTEELNNNTNISMTKIDSNAHLSDLEKAREKILLLDLLDNQITRLQKRINGKEY